MTTPVPDWSDAEEFWVGVADVIYDDARIARADREVTEIEALLGLDRPVRVLDLACGPGRHSVQLARRGYDVVGVDRTAAYIGMAKELAASTGVSPELVQADSREFVADPPVDVVLNLWTSFGYFEDPADNLRVLRNARASLGADGGVLMLQTRSRETIARHHPVPRTWEERGGKLLLSETRVLPGWDKVTGRWIVVDDRGRRDYPWTAWLYGGPDLSALMREAGFGSVELYGAFDGRPYDGDAKYLVAVART